jgi:hypothetical protein
MQRKLSMNLSIILGFMIFMFGFLKFVDPFKTWYAVQIQTSGLPDSSYYAGIFGELIVGILLISSYWIASPKLKFTLSTLGSFMLVGILSVAIYVHLLPQVPAEVLPMKIKPPFVPILFLTATIVNIYLSLSINSKTRNLN